MHRLYVGKADFPHGLVVGLYIKLPESLQTLRSRQNTSNSVFQRFPRLFPLEIVMLCPAQEILGPNPRPSHR